MGTIISLFVVAFGIVYCTGVECAVYVCGGIITMAISLVVHAIEKLVETLDVHEELRRRTRNE